MYRKTATNGETCFVLCAFLNGRCVFRFRLRPTCTTENLIRLRNSSANEKHKTLTKHVLYSHRGNMWTDRRRSFRLLASALFLILRSVEWQFVTDVSGQTIGSLLKNTGPTGCPKTSVTNYRSTSRKIPEEGRSRFLPYFEE